jgi:alanine dehydrogenase
MPGAVARTSTFALNNATLAYGARIADLGVLAAARADRAIARGINAYAGHITHQAVAPAVNLPFKPLTELT